jgi:hypothetical protein
VLIADFAALDERKSVEAGRKRRHRVDELPTGSRNGGYPEYTAIAWTPTGEVVVGSRYRGIYVGERELPATAPARRVAVVVAAPTRVPSPGCVLR